VRGLFQQQLTAIETAVHSDLELAAEAVAIIAGAVADTRAPTPSSIEGAARLLRNGARAADRQLVELIALQAPIAGDLRLTLALMHVTHHEGLIANQFDLITAQLMETDPDIPGAPGTAVKLKRMAEHAAAALRSAKVAVALRDVELARGVARDDDVIDRLNRSVFAAAVQADGGELERDVAMRQILIARSLERIADNAVDIAEQAAFLATGEPCEFSDASHPGRAPA
jgi:phosphate transport system protein